MWVVYTFISYLIFALLVPTALALVAHVAQSADLPARDLPGRQRSLARDAGSLVCGAYARPWEWRASGEELRALAGASGLRSGVLAADRHCGVSEV